MFPFRQTGYIEKLSSMIIQPEPWLTDNSLESVSLIIAFCFFFRKNTIPSYQSLHESADIYLV